MPPSLAREIPNKSSMFSSSIRCNVAAAAPVLSAVHRGTLFEERALGLLQDHMSMSLRRVGGKSDGGIDLMGWWWLPPLLGPSAPDALEKDDRRRFRVLAQCKAEKKKMSPKYVREMEGVLHRHMAAADASASGSVLQYPLVAMLVSESPFTKSTILRAQSSPVPFLLLHVPPLEDADPDAAQRGEADEERSADRGGIGSAVWNPALGGSNGLLRGQFEARWELSGRGTGRPGLWWNGRRLRSWTPQCGIPDLVIPSDAEFAGAQTPS